MSAASPSGLQRFAARRLPWLLGMLAILALIRFFAEAHWLLSITVHFHFFYGAASIVLTLAAACLRCWRLAMAGLALAGWFFATPMTFWMRGEGLDLTGSKAAALQPRHSFLSFNLLFTNTRHAEVLQALTAADADFILLLEATPAWQNALQPLAKSYPHQLHKLFDHPFGIWFLSRHPLEDAVVEEIGDEFPVVSCNVSLNGKRLRLAGVHPVPPGSAATHRLQREQLSRYPDLLTRHPGDATILAGDFNATPFSQAYSTLLESTGLVDSRRGFGWRHTWTPCGNLFIGLPLDYVLVSKTISVIRHEIGPDLGSDHRWVRVEFALP